jgi:hypothetical protein
MTDLNILMSFPTEAPYRIDQVTNNPGLMLSLAIGQLLLAGLLSRRDSSSPLVDHSRTPADHHRRVLHARLLGDQRHCPL